MHLTEPSLILVSQYRDHRGFFCETYSCGRYEELGIDAEFVQDNHSLSHDIGTLRGLHFQAPPAAQGKLVRGELEITSLLETYLSDGTLRVEKMGTEYAWLDTGTHVSLLDANNFVRTRTERQGLQVGFPDEVACQLRWITKKQLGKRAMMFGKNHYGQYLGKLT